MHPRRSPRVSDILSVQLCAAGNRICVPEKREKWTRGVSIRTFVLLRAAGTRLTIAGYRALHT